MVHITTASIRPVIAEFVGTAFLVIAAIGSAILPYDVLGANISLSVFINAVAVGAVLFVLVETFGPVSNAHFNPAVSLSMYLSGQMRGKDCIGYIVAQFSGGFAGVVATHLMFYNTKPVVLVISQNVKASSLFLAELIGTFLLVIVIYGVMRNKSKFASLAIGSVVCGMLITTSSTMYANPAVTFARVFTYAICGIEPFSAILFVAFEVVGSLLATTLAIYVFPMRTEMSEVSITAPAAAPGNREE
ncbi:MAG: MIP/aquaporin family protein [Methanomassiliicoccales archaeon]